MQDELDKNLESIFREQRQSLQEEPFVGNTLSLIKKHRSRRVFQQNLILLMAVVCCALLSQYFIKGSILLSFYLDRIFKAAELLINKPT